MANIDLDAARAARRAKREAESEPNTVTFNGVTFELPPEMAFNVADGLRTGDWHVVMEALLGPEQAEQFFASKPSTEDLKVLLTGDEELGIPGIVSLYAGDDQGESLASSTPSNENGNGLRPVSNLSTPST